jgi:hypothetical protein
MKEERWGSRWILLDRCWFGDFVGRRIGEEEEGGGGVLIKQRA